MPLNLIDALTPELKGIIAHAIMGAENNKNMGVLSVPTTNPKQILNNSIQNNWDRWTTGQQPAPWINEHPQKFIDFMQRRWAPIGAENDPNNLNANWAPNVRALIQKQVTPEEYQRLQDLNIVHNHLLNALSQYV